MRTDPKRRVWWHNAADRLRDGEGECVLLRGWAITFLDTSDPFRWRILVEKKPRWYSRGFSRVLVADAAAVVGKHWRLARWLDTGEEIGHRGQDGVLGDALRRAMRILEARCFRKQEAIRLMEVAADAQG